MRTIRIDDDVWLAIQKEAEPLVDTPNSVLRRLLLGLDNGSHPLTISRESLPKEALPALDAALERMKQKMKKNPRRAIPGELLPHAELRTAILAVLASEDGELARPLVIDGVFARIKHQLSALDLEASRGSTEPRWKNRIQFQRIRMIDDGLLDRSSPRGIWRLTDAGWRAAGKPPPGKSS